MLQSKTREHGGVDQEHDKRPESKSEGCAGRGMTFGPVNIDIGGKVSSSTGAQLHRKRSCELYCLNSKSVPIIPAFLDAYVRCIQTFIC